MGKTTEEHIEALDGDGCGGGLDDPEVPAPTDERLDPLITDVKVPGKIKATEVWSELWEGG